MSNMSQKTQEDPVHWKYTIRDENGTIHPVGNFILWYQGQPDNYNVRMICGVRCTNITKYQISQDLFRYTLQRLVLFAHIIFVDDMELSFGKFARAYGWQYHIAYHGQSMDTSAIMNTTLSETKEEEEEEEDWDPYMSALDDALYEFAQYKYHHASQDDLSTKIDTLGFSNRALVEEYFQLGPSRGCSNQCCGVCTKW
jgi:hypothetical protein